MKKGFDLNRREVAKLAGLGSLFAVFPNMPAWIATFVMAIGIVAPGVIAWLAHKDATRPNTAYEHCVDAISADFDRPVGS